MAAVKHDMRARHSAQHTSPWQGVVGFFASLGGLFASLTQGERTPTPDAGGAQRPNPADEQWKRIANELEDDVIADFERANREVRDYHDTVSRSLTHDYLILSSS